MNQVIPKQTEVEEIARVARLHLAKDGLIAQTAFIWHGNNVAILGGRPLKDKVDKAAWASILRRSCIELEADTILTVMEVWAASVKGPAKDVDLTGPVEGRDGAYEAVMFHLETMDGTWMCIVPIIRSEGQGPGFAMPRHWIEGNTSGILTNFIPDKKASAYTKQEKL